MHIEYLNVEDVEELHDLALAEYGGLPGREKNKLEGILGIPYAGYGDFEKYPSIVEKAAVYLYYLASGHGFIDGNKRTAYLSVFTFLDWNGYDLIVPDDEVYRFIMLIACDKTRPPFNDAVHWIEKYMIKQAED
ncbi:type II toxin-antitoxin system death-on-curing family toxin [Bacillus sp. V33-4]|nr:type II toxin-antitoxin system death-on-curing family toxin [Bacillus sp. V33-4]